YDATGRLSSVAAPNGETIGFTYDAGGRLVEQRLHSGQRTTQSWFEDGGLKQKQNLFNTTVLTSHLYTLDNQGRRSGQTENIGGTTKSWSYIYDNLDRITTASDGTAETYGYDIFGNRRSKTKSGTTTAYLYDNAHQLSEVRSGSDTGTLIGAAVHDADGHMTKLCENGTVTKTTTDCTATGTGATTLALVWNALDHLNTATRTGANAIAESYAYDDSGRRISKTSAGTTTSYLYDGDAIHAEWSGSISGNPAAAYVHGAGIDEPLVRLTGTTNSPGATQAAYIQDGLGSVVGLANQAGTLTANQRFDAWGNKTTSSGTVPQYGYTGREPDATGMVFYRARYYHPGIARFASRDPMGMVDSVSPYAYVASNPISLVDPLGLEAMLSGTALSPAYWNMLADASLYSGTQTDVRGGGNGGTFTPGQQKLPSQSGSGVGDFLLGFIPGYDLYQATQNSNAGVVDYAVGILGIAPGLGKGAGLGVKGADTAADILKVNRAQGKAGEALTEAALKQNGTFAGKQVTFETSTGQRTVIDFVTDVPGGKGVIETKTGGGTLTSGQRQLFDDIQNGRAVIPRGNNAFDAGLKPNQPTTLRSCGIDRPCP
ncbi:MAG: RHS repeat-associated core domain-containing protein, partial [Thiobacillus sp.]|nr:RHS repeat-associated core domain-containing protein [Thiobacillus sp.]